MSRKGNCRENARVAGFFRSLKVAAIHGEPLMNHEQICQTVFAHIEVGQRRHSALDYLSLENYEKIFPPAERSRLSAGSSIKGLDPGQAGSRKRCCDATAGPRSGPRTAHTADN